MPQNHYGMGVAVGDYDNDGFEDIYVTGYGGNTLYHNNRNGPLPMSPPKLVLAREDGAQVQDFSITTTMASSTCLLRGTWTGHSRAIAIVENRNPAFAPTAIPTITTV